jgi:site-specific recombinase XerD
LKPTTLANYERYAEQDIGPSKLGAMLLTDIRRAHVNAWVADLAESRGAVTVRRALATLRLIFSAAVRDEIISANPALMVDKPAVPDSPVTAVNLAARTIVVRHNRVSVDGRVQEQTTRAAQAAVRCR